MTDVKSKENEFDEIARKYKKPMEKLFLICFAIIFVYDYISSSMIMFPMTYNLGHWLMSFLPEDLVAPVYESILNLRHLIIIPAVFTVLFEAKGIGRKIFLCTMLALGWFYAIYWREIQDTMVFSSLLVIVACATRDIKKIVKIALISGASVILLAFVLTRIGWIEDLTWTTHGGAFERHAFGMNYCTDLACHVMFLILLYMFLRQGRLRWWEYAAILVLSLINVLYVDGRIALFCTFVAVAGCVIYGIGVKKKIRIPDKVLQVMAWAFTLVFVIAAAVMFISALLYKDDPNLWYNQSLSWQNRLWTNHILLEQLPFSWFGTYFRQVGWGGVSGPLDYYFWVDCSYNRIYAMYGLVAFLVYMALLTGIQLRLKKRKAYFTMFLMCLVAMDCMMEHHLIEVAFNTFLVFAFADLDTMFVQEKPAESGVSETTGTDAE